MKQAKELFWYALFFFVIAVYAKIANVPSQRILVWVSFLVLALILIRAAERAFGLSAEWFFFPVLVLTLVALFLPLYKHAIVSPWRMAGAFAIFTAAEFAKHRIGKAFPSLPKARHAWGSASIALFVVECSLALSVLTTSGTLAHLLPGYLWKIPVAVIAFLSAALVSFLVAVRDVPPQKLFLGGDGVPVWRFLDFLFALITAILSMRLIVGHWRESVFIFGFVSVIGFFSDTDSQPEQP